jgi:type I restriction enzyme S subunit
VLAIRISAPDRISPEFLYYLLSADKFFAYEMEHAKGAKMPRGDKPSVMKYRIPSPSLPEQERVVAILDKFDALVNDLSIGLPSELAARRKQYEHYRNRLLTFKELAA